VNLNDVAKDHLTLHASHLAHTCMVTVLHKQHACDLVCTISKSLKAKDLS